MWRNYLWKQHLSNYRRVILDFTLRNLDMNHNICFYHIHVHKWLKYDHIATDTTSPLCRYTICKCNPLICQIRLDFTAFELAPPFTCGGSSTSVACTTTDGPLIGDCIYDTFMVTSPGSTAPPVICGYNTGQHMYITSSDLCNNIVIKMDPEYTFSRRWDIKVTQYECGQHQNMIAPPGCLQWNTGTIGTIQNFNFKDTSSYHLSSQKYAKIYVDNSHHLNF